MQAGEFRDTFSEFEAMGWAVVGYGSDPKHEAAGWKADQGYPFPLLCDPAQTFARKIGFTQDYKGRSAQAETAALFVHQNHG